uniref:Beta-N-acetylglucosaminidase n=1 Tax=uncultured organism TaxID=155900 RepID=K7NA15_9ZZZZ|nr:beta-N-acetylglucosaminidase [uncultured organism]
MSRAGPRVSVRQARARFTGYRSSSRPWYASFRMTERREGDEAEETAVEDDASPAGQEPDSTSDPDSVPSTDAGDESEPADELEQDSKAEGDASSGDSKERVVAKAEHAEASENARTSRWWLALVALIVVEFWAYGKRADVEICVGKAGVHDFGLVGQERTDANRWSFPRCETRENLGLRGHFDEVVERWHQGRVSRCHAVPAAGRRSIVRPGQGRLDPSGREFVHLALGLPLLHSPALVPAVGYLRTLRLGVRSATTSEWALFPAAAVARDELGLVLAAATLEHRYQESAECREYIADRREVTAKPGAHPFDAAILGARDDEIRDLFGCTHGLGKH